VADVARNFGKSTVKINTLVSNLRESGVIVEAGNFRSWRDRGQVSIASTKRPAEAEPEADEAEGDSRKSPRKLYDYE
jgi:hypothetical protein